MSAQCATCADYELERPKFVRLTQLSRQAVRDYEDLRSCYEELKQHYEEQQRLAKKYRNENASLQLKVQEQQETLNRLQNASEAVCEEYGMLRSRYNAETKAASKVLKKASQWYLENQDLRRTSQILWEKVAASGEDLSSLPVPALSAASSTSSDLTSNGTTAHDEETEQLRQTVADLRLGVTCLKGELERSESGARDLAAKNERLLAELESERTERSRCQKRLAEMEDGMGRLNRVSVLAAREYFELRKKFEDESERNRVHEKEAARVEVCDDFEHHPTPRIMQ
ncbi:hypothetical protein HPB52_017103 [Rhipicephalus sanguineus]|uniref:Shootin-1 n=1 Tax=Rhipicephalus sanguineus TaxID=34632 RepID=A0A9D4SZB7_RHISA|nr:hypothetical protein HPB52_017103 [Rhipicephalus sanguineus]